jgi:hypothetical protein
MTSGDQQMLGRTLGHYRIEKRLGQVLPWRPIVRHNA